MQKIDYKLFLEIEGQKLCRILEAIDQYGSINRASSELKISYRHAWGVLKAAEERLATTLLAKRVGGAAGGGTELTETARALLAQYRQLRAQLDQQSSTPTPITPRPVLLASTISPVETGLVHALEEAFFEATKISVRHIAAGSGQAFDLAREGRADLVLTHAPDMEEAFIAEGFGTARHPLMQNDFLLVGPASDPAKAAAAESAKDAFARLAAARAAFLTRGDRSGTHVRELQLWEAAGVTPAAPWYQVCPRGAMGSIATLRSAEQQAAYVLVDRAAWLTAHAQGSSLVVICTGYPEFHNGFSLIPVSPDHFPHAQHQGASSFVAWATSPQGQAVIGQFGVNRYGEPLFLPAAARG